MKNNNKLAKKTVELSWLKCISAGSRSGGVYLPPAKLACQDGAIKLRPPGE